uniref:Uncharacterized protein n=1 Tax=Seriola dumerili TaxID=41447 RepID=A0A3B4UVW1_SERDU
LLLHSNGTASFCLCIRPVSLHDAVMDIVGSIEGWAASFFLRWYLKIAC